MVCDVPDIAYYEYYDYQQSEYISFVSESGSGKEHECVYFIFTPKDTELDENTPVIAYVTHGGGVADEERAIALNCAAALDTEAIFIVPWTDRPDGVCASLEDAKEKLGGIGNFDAISGHGTSSGGRAIVRAALHSVTSDKDYSFRFANVIAYDPTKETHTTNITGNVEGLKGLAEQGTVLLFQTDEGHNNGSGDFCNYYAEVYSQYGGLGIVAELPSGNHEAKFMKPITHNSIGWAAGLGPLLEDDHYQNTWFYYSDGVKTSTNLTEATEFLSAAAKSETEDLSQSQQQETLITNTHKKDRDDK